MNLDRSIEYRRSWRASIQGACDKIMPNHTILFSLAVVLLPAGASAIAKDSGLSVGRPFPEIVLPSLKDGTPMSITSFRGHKVILHVFASW